MSPTREQLINMTDAILTTVPEVPGKIWKLPIAGVIGNCTPLSHPFLNVVRFGTGTDVIMAAAVAAVAAYFAERERAFGWLLCPRDAPSVPAMLTASGLVPLVEMAGMARIGLAFDHEPDPAISVREIGADERDFFATLQSVSYGLPEAMVSHVCEVYYFHPNRPYPFRFYIADYDGEPQACASIAYLPDGETVYLSGAATMESYRGRGLYRALVARRLADAHATGRVAAIIQADRSSSAPLCERMGFEEIAGYRLYAWLPPDQEAE